MEVALRSCPACNAVVMDNESVCLGCGAELPAAASAAPVAPPPENRLRSRSAADEKPCSGCGMMLPPGVLRCRDCGTYVTVEVEQAAMARMANRIYSGAGGNPIVGVPKQFGGGFSNSGFSTIADDDDFDLNPNVSFSETPAQSGGGFPVASQEEASEASESDFEMPNLETSDYGLTDEPPTHASPAPSVPILPPPVPVESIPVAADPESKSETSASPTAEAHKAHPAESVDHSVNTAGEALLNTALEEQIEAQNRAKGGRRKLRLQSMAVTPGRFLVFCPKGHRVQVQEKHRGRTGRCPNCKTMFFVPVAETSETSGEAGAPAAADAPHETTPAGSSGYTRWLNDVILHRVQPKKLKLLPGSLLAEGLPVDLGFAPDHILVAVLYAGGGFLRNMQEPKQKAANRKLLLDHLAANKALVELKIPGQHTLSRDQLPNIRIAQPSIPGEESLFADVPVFGEGRIGVRIPGLDTASDRGYLSFTLSQFRQFAEILGETYGLADFGAGTSIPLQDDFVEMKCHYSDVPLPTVSPERLPYYKADTSRKLVVLGHKCEKCGLIISEDSRKKEKVGGKSPDSVAGSKCPKCKQKMGKGTLYGFSAGATA